MNVSYNKLTSHQLDDMRGCLFEDNVQVLRVALLKLLLQEATTVLILAQGVDLMTGHRLEIIVHKAVGIYYRD